ncbi:MAG: HAMP domain-containing sensor histidine kinase, partial [Saprospiraceae bacterium]|nr:HAMP domain-containing sensor histidine kinase [Saprospiraceae bacterium]
LLNSASHFVAIALENAMLYEQMELMLKAKKRAINHLSHELITPLAIISGVLQTIRRKIGTESLKELDRTLNRGLRNVERLLDLQRKIDDIFNHRQLDDQKRMLRIIKTAVDLVEGLGEEHGGSQQKSLELISTRLSDLFQLKEPRIETIFLTQFLDGMCDRIALQMGNRNIRIEREFGRPIHLITDFNMLSMVCEGLLQNAIENTPDEGRICVSTYREEGLISIQVHDYGVGITPENQKNIFVGFFHTQKTDLYASKSPYAFNAGGTGVDLLRIKSFAERFGFDIDFESRRCCYLPTDSDVCPGRISECRFVEGPMDCQRSGFSTFKLTWK